VLEFFIIGVAEEPIYAVSHSVPEEWNADFYELYRANPTSEIMIQCFRTAHPIDRFVATPLARDLPGVVDMSWNRAHNEERDVRTHEEIDQVTQGLQQVQACLEDLKRQVALVEQALLVDGEFAGIDVVGPAKAVNEALHRMQALQREAGEFERHHEEQERTQ
jgi:hypothetical protein